MKIAVVGMGPGAEDVPPDWTIWALLNDPVMRHRAELLFAMHPRDAMEAAGQIEMAEDVDAPVVWQYADEAMFVRYPLEDVLENIGRDWFESSIALMLGLALAQSPDAVGLWGIHMADDAEYLHQRPNICWLLGIAEARGIDVVIPDGCRLLTHTGPYAVRYGYE